MIWTYLSTHQNWFLKEIRREKFRGNFRATFVIIIVDKIKWSNLLFNLIYCSFMYIITRIVRIFLSELMFMIYSGKFRTMSDKCWIVYSQSRKSQKYSVQTVFWSKHAVEVVSGFVYLLCLLLLSYKSPRTIKCHAVKDRRISVRYQHLWYRGSKAFQDIKNDYCIQNMLMFILH